MSESAEISGVKSVKRKKKRSSMQMAKKYARRSERGHGTELDSETYQYMVRILEMLRQDFNDPEEKLNFVNNVYEQTIGREIEYARNQVGSRVLDSLLKYANYEAIKRLSDALSESLRPICSDRFASHVLEEIIKVCAARGNPNEHNLNNDSEKIHVPVEKDEVEKYNEIALKLCRYVVNNFEEFVWDTYANHVLRTVLECLGGVFEVTKDCGNKKSTTNYTNRRSVNQNFTDLLVDAANRLLNWPQFLEFGKDELTSALTQTLLHTLKPIDSKLSSKIVKKICEAFTENSPEQLSTIFHEDSSERLLEVCLAVAKSKTFDWLHKRFFVGRLKELSLMSGGNFAVQRLLDNCHSKETFEEIFDELTPHLGSILERKNTGIVASLANACERLQCRQGPFVSSISKTLNCEEAEKQSKIVPAVAALQSSEKIQESSETHDSKLEINLHGSIALQAMLRFNKPIKIVNSLLAMKPEDVVELFSNPKGSRILDAFMESKFIGEKSREKLAKSLQGHWVDLAKGIHGSRCLEKIWSWSKSNQRHWIMEELARAGESLNSTKTGKIISAKLNVPLYARNKKDWSDAQGKEAKTKALFADIIGDLGSKNKNEKIPKI
ncbi:nucleolar protein 9 [Venturia canescens]|uniref:nucleolar protein 9 n=1 Tax=Venturia canescens TaxID=32260 RepID=UPI001C9C5327|nr:nucleolar protein 9 [Venturia canescens]